MINKILNATKETLNAIDMGRVMDRVSHPDKSYLLHSAGEEHYRLLAFISSIFNDSILFDVGTYRGLSAYSLSYSQKNRVVSYDEIQWESFPNERPQIDFRIGDATKDPQILKASFIFLDVWHDGSYERKMLNHLMNNNWHGLLMLDDITFEGVSKFWAEVKLPKYDITHIGHHSGTGIIDMTGEYSVI